MSKGLPKIGLREEKKNPKTPNARPLYSRRTKIFQDKVGPNQSSFKDRAHILHPHPQRRQ